MVYNTFFLTTYKKIFVFAKYFKTKMFATDYPTTVLYSQEESDWMFFNRRMVKNKFFLNRTSDIRTWKWVFVKINNIMTFKNYS